MNRSNISRSSRHKRHTFGFTLTELLVAMGVIAVLSVLVVMSMSAISKDARLASGVNTVKAALENARAMAMKKNQIVLVVFRPRFEGVNKRKQSIEVITAKWTGESYFNSNGFGNDVIDRFVPIPDVAIRSMPVGIKVAAPSYGDDEDYFWITQSHLLAINQETGIGEVPGVMIGVMYGPDGTTLSRNSQSDSTRTWVDFHYNPVDGPLVRAGGTDFLPEDIYVDFFNQKYEDDETFVSIAPFLAVYSDDEAREHKTLDWSDPSQGQANYEIELTGPGSDAYITNFAKRIHFNRYTGVMMK
ncbi:MAG: prepilin-type N-terminal cleavage/methylation domain-containing protein [Planctomycetes bacterium]|nr:prepilin-type N-terminal cleavage/methylation domain-containing protein [Planctomycetota bacterium]